MKLLLTLPAIIVMLSSALMAELNIYLIPKYDLASEKGSAKKNITLNDIAQIDGSYEDVSTLKKSVIPEKLYSDGYIDRSEVMDLIMGRYSDEFHVYGTSVRINRTKPEEDKAPDDYEVKSGSTVSFVVKNRGITVHSQGTAAENGRTGDIIQVKLNKKTGTVKGKVVTDKIVELEL